MDSAIGECERCSTLRSKFQQKVVAVVVVETLVVGLVLWFAVGVAGVVVVIVVEVNVTILVIVTSIVA